MTAFRRAPDAFLSGFEAGRPSAVASASQIYVATDTGNSYYSDGAIWTLCSKVAAGGPGNLLNYDTANFTQFASTQLDAAWSLTFDDTRTRHDAGFSGHFQLRAGDIPLSDNHERAEILGPQFTEGDDKWYGWSTYFLDPGLNPTDTASTAITNIFTQIHENRGPGSTLPTASVPPLRVSVDTNNYTFPFHIVVSQAGGPLNASNQPIAAVVRYDLGEITYNTWTDFIFHILHSSDDTIGQLEIWVNGSRPASIPSAVTVATMYPGRNNYFKQGYYRSNQALTTDIWHDMTIIGASKNEVDPTLNAS